MKGLRFLTAGILISIAFHGGWEGIVVLVALFLMFKDVDL